MRYLGNKKRLLGKIERCARGLGLRRGTVCDLFAGTAVVGRHFRARGSRVLSTDLMECSYLFQKVFLECCGPPRFSRLASEIDLPPPAPRARLREEALDGADWTPALRVVAWLEERIEPREGILTRQYTPRGAAMRRYFTPETAMRLDAILAELRAWRRHGLISELEAAFLLCAAIDAADRLANISGTYGAYIKTWQANALGEVELRLPALVDGPPGEAHREDALEWIGGVEADLLYIDPPYNSRQYPANYHLLEVIARIPGEPDLDVFEASIYGKTGLIPWREKASPLCSQRGNRCRDAFHAILRATRIPRLVISYNEEGIISRDEFEEMLAEYAGVPRSRLGRVLVEIPYRRFRSDADGRLSRAGAVRNYQQLPGRGRDEVCEWLFHVARGSGR
ncbi:MAG: DNA adenine methylase [Planctomycetota bacterium]